MFETVDRLERRLVESSLTMSTVVAAMLPIIRELDRAQVDLVDGSRSMTEWLAARLDVEVSTARNLVLLARADDCDLEEALARGHLSIDRAVAVIRLKATGAEADVVDRSFGLDIAGVRRLTSVRTRVTNEDERDVHSRRFLHLQPALDESSYRLWGELPGVDGRIVEKALHTQVDEFPSHPEVSTAQSRADALSSICQDWLSGSSSAEGRSVLSAEIFVDGTLASVSKGQQGATISTGPRVGPNTLAEILCDGQIGLTVHGSDLNPIVISQRRNSIPPAVRRAVLFRDGGMCVIDGCRSRSRLQPHHVQPQRAGVDHALDNLVTLCWFHHHVVVHQMGYDLDPDSPPGRRRFLRPGTRDGPA